MIRSPHAHCVIDTDRMSLGVARSQSHGGRVSPASADAHSLGSGIRIDETWVETRRCVRPVLHHRVTQCRAHELSACSLGAARTHTHARRRSASWLHSMDEIQISHPSGSIRIPRMPRRRGLRPVNDRVWGTHPRKHSGGSWVEAAQCERHWVNAEQ